MTRRLVVFAAVWALGVHCLVALVVLVGSAARHTGTSVQVPALVLAVLWVLGVYFLGVLALLIGRYAMRYARYTGVSSSPCGEDDTPGLGESRPQAL